MKRLRRHYEASFKTKVAIEKYGTPEIINSDQGTQFTRTEWISTCNNYDGMRISMG